MTVQTDRVYFLRIEGRQEIRVFHPNQFEICVLSIDNLPVLRPHILRHILQVGRIRIFDTHLRRPRLFKVDINEFRPAFVTRARDQHRDIAMYRLRGDVHHLPGLHVKPVRRNEFCVTHEICIELSEQHRIAPQPRLHSREQK